MSEVKKVVSKEEMLKEFKKNPIDNAECGNEPIVLGRPIVGGTDPSCGNEPIVLDKPLIGEPGEGCGNGKRPTLPKPGPKGPKDPRLGR